MKDVCELEREIRQAFLEAGSERMADAWKGDLNAVHLEMPRQEEHGDLAIAFALRLAKLKKCPPRTLALEICEAFKAKADKKGFLNKIQRIEVEGPGYINLTLSQEALTDVLREIRRKKSEFGSVTASEEKVLLEFVSANPTGPLTVAHGRQAALGDALARIMRHAGYRVDTEYYNNDEGVQINTLGVSLKARIQEALGAGGDFPENGYKGAYLHEIAKEFIQDKRLKVEDAGALDASVAADYAKNKIFDGIKKDLDDFGVSFTTVYSQKKLGASGEVEKTLEDLKKRQAVFEKDGAVWLRTTDFGDDKDRVLIKSDKTYTYLTPDIAYHRDKFRRGYREIIDILGPDHHGYVARLKASQEALGNSPDRVRVRIAQLVTLYEGTKQVRMSTRAGEFVTLRQVLDEVGRDAARFFFCMRKFESHLDFDLELAKKHTSDNPVFYVQYVHARIASIQRLQNDAGLVFDADKAPLEMLTDPHELRLMKRMRQFPKVVSLAASLLEPCGLIEYLTTLAGSFHQFYENCRVMGEDKGRTQARLVMLGALQEVIRSGLGLLGVSSPDKM